MNNLKQPIALPSSMRYLLAGIVVLGGCFFVFVAYALFVADKSKWPHPVAGVLIAFAMLLLGVVSIYFSFRLIKKAKQEARG